ncbi:MAG: DUF3817 domain-containing protein [Bacteroidota bacterium]
MDTSVIKKFRYVAIAEGWSFVVLLCIAMPLKYVADWPLAVKYVGWAHGLLFVVYMLLLLQSAIAASWSFKKVALGFICALIPFATFWYEKQLLKEIQH